MRSTLALMLTLAACLGPKTHLEARPLPQYAGTEPVRLGVIGASLSEGPDLALRADLVSREVDALVLTGNLSGPRPRDYAHRQVWLDRLDRPTLAVAGPLEGDAPGRFAQLHGGHATDAATWGLVDLETSGVVWRLLALDVTATGDRWHDHLVIVLGRAPWTLASDEAEEDPFRARARELQAAVEGYADVSRLRAVIGGSTGTQEVMLPSGPWGEAWLNAGTSGSPGRSLLASAPGRHGVPLRLAAGLEDELGEGLAPAGWWELVLDGPLASLRLRTEVRDDRFEEVWRIHYSGEEGWTRAVK